MIKFEMKYFNTYYFCSLIEDLVETSDLDFAPLLSEFDTSYLEIQPADFSKKSALHEFCYWVIERLCYEKIRYTEDEINENLCGDTDDINKILNDNNKIFFKQRGFANQDRYKYSIIEMAIMNYCDGRIERLRDWLIANWNNNKYDEITVEYIEYLDEKGLYFDIIWNIVNEVVYLLFQNRKFLLHFNEWLAEMHNYKIVRKAPPKWVQRAVFHREKGRCVICNRDLSGIIDIEEDFAVHLDHMVPIEEGGLNDFSNMQLMCQQCNLKKGMKAYTNTIYRFWFDIDEHC